ncbi:hypothetical protein [Microlunatus sp. GCM10028923]|uniref:hypothetical protein n=1 Tax=Microlunatus sp. GCM10028923 TaxID=3273400 RepID=UPI003622FFF6
MTAILALGLGAAGGIAIGSTMQPTKYVEVPGPVVTVSAPTWEGWETKRYTRAEWKERYQASASNPWQEQGAEEDCIHGGSSNAITVTVVEDHCELNTEQILDNASAAYAFGWILRGGNWVAYAESESDLNWVAGVMGGSLYEVAR